MKRYRICLISEEHGDVELYADSRKEAEEKALHSAAVDWSGEPEARACEIREIDEDGNEVEAE